MISKNNVINLDERRVKSEPNVVDKKANTEASVTDISQVRQGVIKEERRKVKRTILSEFVGASVVVPKHGLMKVAIFDISEKGVSFDIEKDQGQFNEGEEIAMRVYINHQTYFPFSIKISHVQDIEDEAVYRHGASFLQGTVNDEALYHFVKFIENVSTSLKSDKGDVMVSNLK